MRDLEPPPKGYRGLPAWCYRLWLFVTGNRINRSPGTLTRHSQRGVSITAMAGDGDGGSGGGIQWKRQWTAGTSYLKDDIVIRTTLPEQDGGKVAGTYIALGDLDANDLPPGESAIASTANATVTAGAVTGYVLTNPGLGYTVGPVVVTVTGPGVGAAAHATIVNGSIATIVIDTPGTGYTVAGFTIAAPDGIQGWDKIAQFANERFTWVHGDYMAVVDAGRDSGKPRLVLFNTSDDPDSPGTAAAGMVYLDLEDLAAGEVARMRSWDVCVGGVSKTAKVFSTLPV